MKNYELAYLITPDLSEIEAKSLSEKVAGFIAELQGAVLTNAELDRRKLAYPIDKKIEAFLASLEFSLNPEQIKELKKKIISEKEILRHIIVNKAKESKKPKKVRKLVKEENQPVSEKKVEIEKINEKIDEILQ